MHTMYIIHIYICEYLYISVNIYFIDGSININITTLHTYLNDTMSKCPHNIWGLISIPLVYTGI